MYNIADFFSFPGKIPVDVGMAVLGTAWSFTDCFESYSSMPDTAGDPR